MKNMHNSKDWEILRDQKILFRCEKYYIKAIAPKGNTPQYGVFEFDSLIEKMHIETHETKSYPNYGSLDQCKEYLKNFKGYRNDQIIEHENFKNWNKK